MLTAILFSNHDTTVFVLDVPRSLELANGGGRIYSTESRSTPFVAPEPKGKKREAFILEQSRGGHFQRHTHLQGGIQRASQIIDTCWDTAIWCLPRLQSPILVGPQLGRSLGPTTKCDVAIPTILSPGRNVFSTTGGISNEIILNPNTALSHIHLSASAPVLVPAMCAFVWTSLSNASHLLAEYARDCDLFFDMILMDPPWANRSVRHGKQYTTAADQSVDPFHLALNVVKKHRRLNGYVAVWITNKAAIQEQVMESMLLLDFVLVEEWIWVKVTSKGIPITPLEGVWRRPYELLLIFQHKAVCQAVTRRYLFAVPDVHSRKPNLKEMFCRFLSNPSVLEIFARNLTSGWWSIGDEVLKFQQKSAWSIWPGQIFTDEYFEGHLRNR